MVLFLVELKIVQLKKKKSIIPVVITNYPTDLRNVLLCIHPVRSCLGSLPTHSEKQITPSISNASKAPAEDTFWSFVFVFSFVLEGDREDHGYFSILLHPLRRNNTIAALLLLTVYEGLFQSHQHRDLCCHVSLSGASMATLSTLHQQLLPPPTTTLAARGNSCIREEPKQQFSSVLSKQLNHTPITHIPPILCQQEKRKAREKHIAQHHTWNVCLWFWESSGGASVAASNKQYFCLLTRMTSCSTYFVLKNIFYPEKQNVCG